MTKIAELYSNGELIGFQIEGHAGYSIPGRDIVCAAISALTINTINSVAELSTAEMEVREGVDGNIQYRIISRLDTVSRVLLQAAQIGYRNIAEQYPENVDFRGR